MTTTTTPPLFDLPSSILVPSVTVSPESAASEVGPAVVGVGPGEFVELFPKSLNCSSSSLLHL